MIHSFEVIGVKIRVGIGNYVVPRPPWWPPWPRGKYKLFFCPIDGVVLQIAFRRMIFISCSAAFAWIHEPQLQMVPNANAKPIVLILLPLFFSQRRRFNISFVFFCLTQLFVKKWIISGLQCACSCGWSMWSPVSEQSRARYFCGCRQLPSTSLAYCFYFDFSCSPELISYKYDRVQTCRRWW
jgi:hypothetical protein